MPLINNNDREAHRNHLEAKKAEKQRALAEITQMLPSIRSDMIEASKRYFGSNGILDRCYGRFKIKSETLNFPEVECAQIVSNTLTEAFELPSSAFQVKVDARTGEYESYIDISITFTPPIT